MQITSLGDACPTPKAGKFWDIVIQDLQVDTTVQTERLIRSWNPVSIGPPCSVTPRGLCHYVIIVSDQVTFLAVMKCLKISFWYVRFLMFGVLTSWDLSLLRVGINMYWLLSIMCLNGWKLRLYPRMMPG